MEPLEQWVFSSSLAARPVEGVAEKVSDWKPVMNPVQDITPDGRPMEGTAYPEHLAPGVSLDSGLVVSGTFGAVSARSIAGDTDG